MGVRISRGYTLSWSTTFPKAPPASETPMSAAEFKAICAKLKINDSLAASALFGLHWRTCQRYWYGKLTVPGPLARLLRLAATTKSSPTQLRQLAKPIAP